jgi:hypothetical protein
MLIAQLLCRIVAASSSLGFEQHSTASHNAATLASAYTLAVFKGLAAAAACAIKTAQVDIA